MEISTKKYLLQKLRYIAERAVHLSQVYNSRDRDKRGHGWLQIATLDTKPALVRGNGLNSLAETNSLSEAWNVKTRLYLIIGKKGALQFH